VFAPQERDEVRDRLLRLARADERVSGAAITGSAAHGAEDRWSDIDLFFAVADGVDLEAGLRRWTELVYREFDALHHFELRSGSAIYRAFLLPSCLEVDVGFTPATDFGALGPNFRTVFGEAADRPHNPPPDREHVSGLGWHHVLHARTSIERGKAWQAEYWISGVRDQAFTLACLRFGTPAVYAKGVHALPQEVTTGFEDALVRSLAPEELRRALGAAAGLFVRELLQIDADLGARLQFPLLELAGLPGTEES
jgi:predicted nucleotidyltransferase